MGEKKTTAEEHAIIEAEHSPADNINEATKISEEKTGNSGKTRNYWDRFGQSNLKYPNQPQNFNFPEHLISSHWYVGTGGQRGHVSLIAFNNVKVFFFLSGKGRWWTVLLENHSNILF